MRRCRFLILILGWLVVGFLTTPVTIRGAQDAITLSIAFPEFMRNVFGEGVFTQFEADNPGVKVNVVYTGMDSLFVPSPAQDLDDHLEAVQDYVGSADVISVQSSQLSVEATRAGYFLDLSPLASADATLNVEDFVPPVWQSFQWDRGIWALPVSADVIIAIYSPAAFDEAGLSYPNAAWTIEDYATAARKLTEYDTSRQVTAPGLVLFNNEAYLLRAFLGQGLYAPGSIPDSPAFATPALERLLTTWAELRSEGVFSTAFSGNIDEPPLRIFSAAGLSSFPGAGNNTPSASVLLPGNVAGLDVQGFAVSSGTLYPELAYKLANYLTNNVQVANNPFGITPARNSLKGVQPQPNEDGGDGFIFARRNFTPETQAVVEESIANGLPVSEFRYADYALNALELMQSDGLGAQAALQQVEATAITNLQTAADRRGDSIIAVATPIPEVVMQPGEVTLNFGFMSFIRPTPNQELWDQLTRDFAERDPRVGKINIGMDFGTASDYADKYDCFYLPYNAVPSLDVSKVLSLDPFLNADPSFDRNDVVGNVMNLVQNDNRTWALPIAIQPEVLHYNSNLFAQAGIPMPENGWTIDQFTDALRALKPNADDPKPFVPRGAGGNYLLQLVAAYGGLPIDKRTGPPTLNFTDPISVNAIRQVLDLAREGYVDYQELARTQFSIFRDTETIDPIYTDSLNGFNVRIVARAENTEDPYRMTTYPSGNQYTAVSYDMGTAYISANTQNADACYRWISAIASHPELFSAMPARRSYINDPAFVASQGADTITIYNQFDSLMSSGNTINFQSPFAGDANPGNFLVEFWLNRAFDNYVLNDADLESELALAESYSKAYLECAANIPSFDAAVQDRGTYMEHFTDCATLVDPTVSNLFVRPS